MRYERSLAVTLIVAVCAGQGADLCGQGFTGRAK